MLLDIFRPYILAFIPIFVAIDILGNISLFLILTERFSHKQRKKIVHESILYALTLTIIFILIGKHIFKIIGITILDFKIAGGILLLILSVNLLFSKQIRFSHTKKHLTDIGIFPLATPLIAGPALFTMSLIILDEFGILITLTVLILNMALSWLVLEKSEIINKLIGERGVISISKIFEILLAALAVMMIRQGITGIFLK